MECEETADLEAVLPKLDVLYMTRIQRHPLILHPKDYDMIRILFSILDALIQLPEAWTICSEQLMKLLIQLNPWECFLPEKNCLETL